MIPLPKIPYVHHIQTVLANPTHSLGDRLSPSLLLSAMEQLYAICFKVTPFPYFSVAECGPHWLRFSFMHSSCLLNATCIKVTHFFFISVWRNAVLTAGVMLFAFFFFTECRILLRRVGQNHIYLRCICGIFGREITKFTVIYHIRCIYTVLANSSVTPTLLLRQLFCYADSSVTPTLLLRQLFCYANSSVTPTLDAVIRCLLWGERWCCPCTCVDRKKWCRYQRNAVRILKHCCNQMFVLRFVSQGRESAVCAQAWIGRNDVGIREMLSAFKNAAVIT